MFCSFLFACVPQKRRLLDKEVGGGKKNAKATLGPKAKQQTQVEVSGNGSEIIPPPPCPSILSSGREGMGEEGRGRSHSVTDLLRK